MSPAPAAGGTVRRAAPAKLNLYLDLLGRRPDGYHEVETVLLAVDLCDELEVRLVAEPGVHLEVGGPRAAGVPADGSNLVARALGALLPAAGGPGARARLTKAIPAGAGLGGGSSDAAAALLALAALLGAPGDAANLEDLARGLGSDVPFFLRAGAALGRGRGERLEPLPAAAGLGFVLWLAPFACLTPRVYAEAARGRAPAPPGGLARVCRALAAGDVEGLRQAHFNALGIPALRAYPELADLARAGERRLGRPLALSGSGSTLYDVVGPGEAPAVLEALAGLPGERVVVHA